MTAAADPELTASAARLREAREAIGLTQDDVATALGIPRSAVSAIEHCQRSVTHLELARLGRLYRRPMAWLMGGEDPPISKALAAELAGLPEVDQVAVLRFARFLAHQHRAGS